MVAGTALRLVTFECVKRTVPLPYVVPLNEFWSTSRTQAAIERSASSEVTVRLAVAPPQLTLKVSLFPAAGSLTLLSVPEVPLAEKPEPDAALHDEALADDQRIRTSSWAPIVTLLLLQDPLFTDASIVAVGGAAWVMVMVCWVQGDRALSKSTVRTWKVYEPAPLQLRVSGGEAKGVVLTSLTAGRSRDSWCVWWLVLDGDRDGVGGTATGENV